jgi:Nif-specific regulatory protein
MPEGGDQFIGKLSALLTICQRMNSERDLSVLLDLIAREAARLLDADRASIFLLDQDRRELWSKIALGSEEVLRFDARLGIAGAVALNGETIVVDDAHQDSRFYSGVDAQTGYRTLSLLAVPLNSFNGESIGAFEVLNKRGGLFSEEDLEVLRALASNAAIAIETAQLIDELKRHRDQLLEESSQLWKEVEGRFSARDLIGTSEPIQRVVRQIEQIADSSVTVLITGESGTGKERVAKAIHYNSNRARRPFVALNCAALPESLVEMELFGIEKGVATGVDQRVGKFEAASGGTLFLDEIGDLSLTAQAKILRALEERVVERVGGRKPIPVDVRILAATNKDLEGELKRGNFRQDLFYRLKVLHIQTPPLREARQDIPLIANYYLDKYAVEMGKEPMVIDARAMECMKSYSWPGNVRELENEIKRLVVSARRALITERDLPQAIRGSASPVVAAPEDSSASLKETLGELEKQMIVKALESNGHNQVHAAKSLGLSRQGLIKKLKRYGIRPLRDKSATP